MMYKNVKKNPNNKEVSTEYNAFKDTVINKLKLSTNEYLLQ